MEDKNVSDSSSATVKQRLIQLLKEKGVSQADFARRLGVSVAYVSAMRKALPESKVMRVMEIFPDLNRDWLLYGEGEMLLPAEAPLIEHPEEFMVPLLPVAAYAGRLSDFSQSVNLRDCEMVTVPVRDAEMAIRISGNSMEPEIHSGSIAAIARINENAFIPWGNPMVIDSENGVLIKAVFPSAKGESYIEARSYNPAYPAITIPLESIFGLYRIIALIRHVSTL